MKTIGFIRENPWRFAVAAFVFAFVAVLAAQPSQAFPSIETDAREALLVDFDTGAVLLEKNADELMPPSSMSKLMTVYMVFERLKNGALSLDDRFRVSEKAWRKGGSKMFVEVGENVRVEDLLRGIIVQSGNDATIVVAENIAGSEEAFAEMMTQRAREIGLTRSVFRNASGWPDPEHVMTARDLATLGRRIITDFPDYYRLYSETSFTYQGIRQGNRNPLLYRDMGADGLKTGHSSVAGYGLTASAERNGRRLILVINGVSSVQARANEAERLMEWGFREFDNYDLFAAGETVTEAEVWLGRQAMLPLRVKDDLTVTLPRQARRNMRVAAVYEGPIPAPVVEGDRVATLEITAPDIDPIRIPLFAGESVERLGFAGRLRAALTHILWGSAG